jgi:hypothetical protein
MLKRNGKVAHADQDQLNLFDFARTREPANLPDPIRIDGGTPLAGVSADNGARTGGAGPTEGSVVRGAGDDAGTKWKRSHGSWKRSKG